MEKKYRKINKYITEDETMAFFKKRKLEVNKKYLKKLDHGDIIFMARNEEKLTETFYLMKRIFIKPIELAYSCTPGTKKGKEILISNFKI